MSDEEQPKSFFQTFSELNTDDEADLEKYRALDQALMPKFDESITQWLDGCISTYDLFLKLAYELDRKAEVNVIG
jgi:hypothetical protein